MSDDAFNLESVIVVTFVPAALLAHLSKEARKQLLKARHHKHMDEIHAKLAELKAKLHRHKKAATAGS